MKRLEQWVMISSFIGFCWLAMQAVHELGHVLAALFSGATVTQVVLHPFALSQTRVDPNPSPLFVSIAGPVFGACVPVLALLLAAILHSPAIYLFRFFAGFCLIANGVYIGVCALPGIADAGDMLRNGATRWQLILFGLLTAPMGFYLWNGLGPHFGLGDAKGTVNRNAAAVSLLLLAVLAGIEFMLDSR